jgi:nitrilase
MTTPEVVVAAIQMVSSDQRQANLAAAERLIARAGDQGAGLVVLPENFAFLGRRDGDVVGQGESDGNGPVQAFLADQAARHGITLVGGSVPIQGPETGRVRSACLVYGPDGQRLGRYDKRHLFDVTLAHGEAYRESDSFAPGRQPVVVPTPLGRLGLSICYDLRFPEHYLALVRAGAEMLLAPSAFTATTGAAHWASLVRARAIENLCPVVAPDQGGVHANGRATHGESMVVDAWGGVLAACGIGDGEGVAVARLDPGQRDQLRRRIPAARDRMKPGNPHG